MPVTDPGLIEQLEAQLGGEIDPELAAELDRQLAREAAYVPIPQPTRELPGSSLVTRAGRPATTMGGGMLGMRAGAPLGPIPAAVGGILGAGMGSMAYDTGLDVGRAAGVLPPQYPTLGPGQRAMEAARQMQWEMGGQSAAQLFGAPISRMIGNKLTGIRTGTPASPVSGMTPSAQVGSEAQQQAMQAQKLGVDVGLADVSPKSWARNWAKVVGRFPFVGTPFKKAAAAKATQAGHGLDKIVVKLGPTVSMAEQGINLNKAAGKAFQTFRDEAAQYYKLAREAGEEAGAVIPTKAIREAVADIAQKEQKRWGMLVEGAEGTRRVASTPVEADEVGSFLKDVANIEDTLTAAQLDTFFDDISRLMGRSKAQGWDISRLMTLKKAGEQALRSPEVAEVAPDLASAVKEADQYFASGMRTFETPTAQKFGQVTRGGFQVGLKKQGTMNEDELFRLAWNDRSPKAMRDLRKLVGKDTYQQALHTHLRKVYNQSAANSGYLGRLNADLPDGEKIINPDQFLKSLGLKQPGSAEFDALKEALKGTGITTQALTDFANVVKVAFSSEVPDVSTFIARRATLGGARSLIRGLAGPGGAVMAGGGLAGGLASSPLTAAGITVLTRHMGTVLTDPTKLRLFTTSLRQSLPYQQRRAAMVRLLNQLTEVEDDQ